MTGSAAPEPRTIYAERLAGREEASLREAASSRRLSNLRLAVFVLGVAMGWLAFGARSLDPLWLVLPAAAFVALVVGHDRRIRAHQRAERAVAFYRLGLARLDGSWVGQGVDSEARRDPSHPYAEDLDLFGRGSLFERLCVARTRAGEDALASWLREPAPPDEVRLRQGAVAELRDALDLREDLALLGEDVRAGIHPEALEAWGTAPPRLEGRALRIAAVVLPACTLAGLGAWLVGGAGALPFLAGLVVQGGFAWSLRSRVRGVTQDADLPGRDLALLAELLARLEREHWGSEKLAALAAVWRVEGVSASRRIGRLRRSIDLLDARRNQLFAPIAGLLLWSTQLAFAIERWRAHCGASLAPWLRAVGELEALCSLAAFAWERRDCSVPEIDDATQGARFEATGLGHPLLSAEACVRNDFALADELRVVVVSGSNMSGKSTLLRSVGSNALLALAGAPVCAERLIVSPLAVAASIQVRDSLLEGRSRFYAEIERLRLVLELAEGPNPVLFLLDEVLHGTNSHDRGIGAEAVVRGLVERGASGLVTTHDLALTHIAESLAPAARNAHFEDRVEADRMIFDYRLREGVVERSNALALMRAVGIEV